MTEIERQLSDWLKKNAHTLNFSGSPDAKRQLQIKAERLKAILEEKMASLPFHVTVNIGEPHIVGNQGEISLNFDHEEVERESWYSDKYDEPVDLIILFNNGYDAKHHVIDKSSGRILKLDSNKGDNSELGESSYRVSLTHRDPLRFVQEAIEQFNSEQISSDICAEYDEDLYVDR